MLNSCADSSDTGKKNQLRALQETIWNKNVNLMTLPKKVGSLVLKCPKLWQNVAQQKGGKAQSDRQRAGEKKIRKVSVVAALQNPRDCRRQTQDKEVI